MLDLAALPGLTRAGRVQMLDSWLGKLLDDAVTGTPPQTPTSRSTAAVG